MKNHSLADLLKTFLFCLIVSAVTSLIVPDNSFSFVERADKKIYIVDRTGEKWDVTQAESIGFKPERFQYGLGRTAFTPLDDSSMRDNAISSSPSMRIIGIADGSRSQAYSVSSLSRHEIANSRIGKDPIAVGY
jgi:hypothetical protein